MVEELQPKYLMKRDAAKQFEGTFSHPWNPRSEVRGTQLARTLGLKRTGVSIAHLAPGKESFTYHSHLREEEWIYILAGRGIAEIDGREYEVGAGDFMAFPTPSVAHHLRNPFETELSYLMGGENLDVEIADFPKLGKRMLRTLDKVEVVDLAQVKPFGPLAD
jgi:uncharacterized cupin superfamily protein